MTSKKRPGAGEISPSGEREYALDIERDSLRDDWRTLTWLIDLDSPMSQDPGLSRFKQRERELRRRLRTAQERVGRSDEDRMRWLFHFASLQAAAVEDLQCEIFAFAVPSTTRLIPVDVYATSGEINLFPEGFLHWVCSGLGELKNSLVEGRPVEWSVNIQLSHRFTWLNGRLVDQPRVDEEGLTFERFKAQVCNVLNGQGHRVRLCQNCTELFVGRKRQTYCTAKCSQIKRTKGYRERHPDRIREQRHEAHVRQQQRRHGPKVKVTRHQRKRP